MARVQSTNRKAKPIHSSQAQATRFREAGECKAQYDTSCAKNDLLPKAGRRNHGATEAEWNTRWRLLESTPSATVFAIVLPSRKVWKE